MENPPLVRSNLKVQKTSLKSKKKETEFKQVKENNIGSICWEYFDICEFIKNTSTKNFRILLYGSTDAGKSVFSSQLVLKKILFNMENKKPTILSAFSSTPYAHKMLLNRIYPLAWKVSKNKRLLKSLFQLFSIFVLFGFHQIKLFSKDGQLFSKSFPNKHFTANN